MFFKKQTNLEKHVETVHEKKKSLKWAVCDKSISRKENLNEHKRVNHSSALFVRKSFLKKKIWENTFS
jgi:hypothetical protein